MLVKVAALVRLVQVEPNGDCPFKKLGPPKILLRCGILPARSRDKRADVPEGAGALLKAFSEAKVEPGRKGLVEGVGRDVLDVRRATLGALFETVGEILDGKVPALPLRAGLFIPVSVKGTRSGNPSAFGDSGISNRGVDVPLVGGPQILEVVPVGVCSSRVRFGNNLEADSCSGEPDPTRFRFKPARLLTCELDLGAANGDLLAEEVLGSTMGDKPDRLIFREPSALPLGPMMDNYVLHSLKVYLAKCSDDNQVDLK